MNKVEMADDIAHDQQRGPVGNRRQQRPHQHHAHHRRLVDHQQAAIERVLPISPEPAGPLGSTSSSRWIVFAPNPVASLIRLATRPVGAHSRISTPLADRMRRIAVTTDSQESQAETAIAGYIDGFYNPIRRYSTLDFTSPGKFKAEAMPTV